MILFNTTIQLCLKVDGLSRIFSVSVRSGNRPDCPLQNKIRKLEMEIVRGKKRTQIRRGVSASLPYLEPS